jgi:hypothetical protein
VARRTFGCIDFRDLQLAEFYSPARVYARGLDLASSLWAVAEELTGTTLPADVVTPSR